MLLEIYLIFLLSKWLLRKFNDIGIIFKSYWCIWDLIKVGLLFFLPKFNSFYNSLVFLSSPTKLFFRNNRNGNFSLNYHLSLSKIRKFSLQIPKTYIKNPPFDSEVKPQNSVAEEKIYIPNSSVNEWFWFRFPAKRHWAGQSIASHLAIRPPK